MEKELWLLEERDRESNNMRKKWLKNRGLRRFIWRKEEN